MAKEMSEKIRVYAPHLYQHLKKQAEDFNVTIEQYIEDSKFNYVHIDKAHKILDDEKAAFENLVYAYKEECEIDACSGEYVLTQYEYILLLYIHEKEDREMVRKWGYEFTINDDDTITIRRTGMKRITIQVDVSNKITLV